ncbi:hypothetical protein K438DRAFT_2024647 [Mycena galopus ATCC 62051]|nr:hypothetical protein K438DRAFT_2024647 [Mycena galopus ATCC 62051]
MSSTYKLLVQSAEGVLWKPGPLRQKRPNLCVAVYKDDLEVHRTRARRGLEPHWDDLSMISADSSSSTISLRLWHDSALLGRDVCLGSVDLSFTELLEMCTINNNENVVSLPLKGIHEASNAKPTGTIFVCLTRKADVRSAVAEQAQRDAAKIKPEATSSVILKTGDIITDSPSSSDTLQTALGTLMNKIKVLVDLGDKIAIIHPYANIAWTVLTSVYKAAKQQQETDEKLLKLVDTMANVHSFVEDTSFLEELQLKVNSVEDKTLAIVKQTAECALFIQHYVEKGFWSRALRETWTHADQRIDELATKLLDLRDALEGHLVVQSVFLSTKTRRAGASLRPVS